MSRIRKSLGLAAASAMVVGGMLGATLQSTAAQDASPEAAVAAPSFPPGCGVIASGLANPRFLTIDDGIVYVSLAGTAGDEAIFAEVGDGTPQPAEPITQYGATGSVIAISDDSTVSEVASGLPSLTFGTEVIGPAGIDIDNGIIYLATGGVGPATGTVPALEGRAAVWSIDLATGEAQVIADLETYEIHENPDPWHIDSDPYGLVVGQDGMIYVADAGGNDILRVDPATGETSVLAVIPGLPGQQANPDRGDALEIDAVPTGLTNAPDGGLYVSLLSGGPFFPQTAALMHVSMDGEVTTVASGLTMLSDVTIAPDGSVYVVTMSENFIDPAGPAPGAIVKINPDGSNQTIISGIPFPNGIEFDGEGNAYITAMVSLPAGTPPGGMVWKCSADAFQMMSIQPVDEGTPVAAEATPAA